MMFGVTNVLCVIWVLAAICQAAITPPSCKCVNGLNGRDGRDGMSGRDGKDCKSLGGGGAGRTGPEGPAGKPGTNGVNGMPGSPGSQGPQGAAGSQGPKGDKGDSGADASAIKSKIERMVKDALKQVTGTGTAMGSVKRTTVCSSLAKDVCGDCQCREKNYADEFFSRGYYCDCQVLKPERDCKQHKLNGQSHDGIYLLNPGKVHPFPAYCDMNTDGGGWTVFQRRIDDVINFKRDWFAYKNGFGNLQHEFWLGNENLYLIQLYDDRRGSEMRIDFQIKEGNSYYEKYGVFEIGDESTKYRLKTAGYSGNGGDWMKDYNGKKFCTYDNDNDAWGGNSAASYGAFWHGYGPSYPYNPNRQYIYVAKFSKGYQQPQVKAFQGKVNKAVKYVTRIEMKVRRK